MNIESINQVFPAETTAEAARELKVRIPSFVHLPGSEEYGDLSVPWNVSVRQIPAAVAEPRDAADVTRLVREAAALGLRVAPQSTGHAAAALSNATLDDVVLVRLNQLRNVRIDLDRGIARVDGGAVWNDVIPLAAEHGLTALHGSAGDVGVVGYALSGGLSWYARLHGLASNHVRSIELVTAAGALMVADADNNADIFWAMRGGNAANFGIVTAVEIDLLELSEAYAGMMIWPIDRAEDVLRAWAAWAPTAPDEITTSFRVMRFPPLPDLPPFLAGRELVVLDGVFVGSEEDGAKQVASLRELGPEIDTFAIVPAASLTALHMDPPGPSPAVGGGALLGELGEEGIRAYLDAVGPGTRCRLLAAELRQLGGAVARPVASGGALSHVEGCFGLYMVAIAPDEEAAFAGTASVEALRAALRPWILPQTYLNFTEGEVPARDGFDAGVYARLKELRDRIDADRVLVANHPIA